MWKLCPEGLLTGDVVVNQSVFRRAVQEDRPRGVVECVAGDYETIMVNEAERVIGAHGDVIGGVDVAPYCGSRDADAERLGVGARVHAVAHEGAVLGNCDTYSTVLEDIALDGAAIEGGRR